MTSELASPLAEVSDHYLGEKGSSYFEWQGGAGEFFAQILAHRFRPYVNPTDVLVDFGCGGGFLLKALQCGRRIGIEVNPCARRHAIGLGIKCYETPDEIPPSTADVVISNHALEHVMNPISALKALRTTLRPGSCIVLCVPIENFRFAGRYDPEDRNHHLYTWTAQLLGNCLVEAGYEIVAIKYRIHMWPRRWTMACYNRFPLWLFNFICYCYAKLTGGGRELLAVARRPAN